MRSLSILTSWDVRLRILGNCIFKYFDHFDAASVVKIVKLDCILLLWVFWGASHDLFHLLQIIYRFRNILTGVEQEEAKLWVLLRKIDWENFGLRFPLNLSHSLSIPWGSTGTCFHSSTYSKQNWVRVQARSGGLPDSLGVNFFNMVGMSVNNSFLC